MNKYSQFLLILCVFWTVSGAFFVARAAAPDIRPGCDPEYMDALEAKSWLLAQRRTSQNQNFIFKPDSVLEYSCFNQFIGYLADNPGTRRFSENYPEYPNWGEISGIGEQSLDFALFETVIAPLISYLTSFDHTFLGGQTINAGGSPPPYGTYDCKAMQFVWGLARCSNFITNETENFYDFPWYAANDPRQIPNELSCIVDSRIASALAESYRGEGESSGDEYEQFVLLSENDPVFDGTPYEEDPMLAEEILDLVLPGDCDKSAIIPTGVYVEMPDQENFEEHFCSIPSCSFDGADLCVDD